MFFLSLCCKIHKKAYLPAYPWRQVLHNESMVSPHWRAISVKSTQKKRKGDIYIYFLHLNRKNRKPTQPYTMEAVNASKSKCKALIGCKIHLNVFSTPFLPFCLPFLTAVKILEFDSEVELNKITWNHLPSVFYSSFVNYPCTHNIKQQLNNVFEYICQKTVYTSLETEIFKH